MSIGQGEGTGLNPQRAKADISNFQSEFFAAANKCSDAVCEFIDGLYINWASPKAVEFMTSYDDKIGDVFFAIPTEECDKIVNKAVEAFNSLSTSQGGPALGGITHMGIGCGTFTLLDEIDGDIGMNIANVTGLVGVFEEMVETGLAAFRQLPTVINFYDPAGSVAAAYETGIKTVTSKIEEMTKSLVTSVREAIETEQNNTNLGKEGAEAALEGEGNGANVAPGQPYNPQAGSKGGDKGTAAIYGGNGGGK